VSALHPPMAGLRLVCTHFISGNGVEPPQTREALNDLLRRAIGALESLYAMLRLQASSISGNFMDYTSQLDRGALFFYDILCPKLNQAEVEQPVSGERRDLNPECKWRISMVSRALCPASAWPSRVTKLTHGQARSCTCVRTRDCGRL
jgi:hypothetical protein